jgi:hypothetical protein
MLARMVHAASGRGQSGQGATFLLRYRDRILYGSDVAYGPGTPMPVR